MKLIKIFNNEDSGIDFYDRIILICVIPLIVAFIILLVLTIYYTIKIPDLVSTIPDDYTTSYKFTKIESSSVNYLFDVVYDNETKVMYTVSSEGEFTVLLNADGTPLLYEGE